VIGGQLKGNKHTHKMLQKGVTINNKKDAKKKKVKKQMKKKLSSFISSSLAYHRSSSSSARHNIHSYTVTLAALGSEALPNHPLHMHLRDI
jgi:hypothetical protein